MPVFSATLLKHSTVLNLEQIGPHSSVLVVKLLKLLMLVEIEAQSLLISSSQGKLLKASSIYIIMEISFTYPLNCAMLPLHLWLIRMLQCPSPFPTTISTQMPHGSPKILHIDDPSELRTCIQPPP